MPPCARCSAKRTKGRVQNWILFETFTRQSGTNSGCADLKFWFRANLKSSFLFNDILLCIRSLQLLHINFTTMLSH